jgi:hypothetical protein
MSVQVKGHAFFDVCVPKYRRNICPQFQGTRTIRHIPQGRHADCLLHYSLFAQINNEVLVLRIRIK